MAIPTNLWSTYGVGWPKSVDSNASNQALRENLMEAVVVLDPYDTAVLNMLPKEELNAPYLEWLTDTLEATSTSPSPEGETFGATALTGRQRYANVTQIRKKDFEVSRSMQQASRGIGAPGPPGRDEYQKQLWKKLKEVLRDVDSRLFASGSASWASATGAQTSAAATARRTHSFRAWIASGGNATGAFGTNVGGAFGTATFSALHEAMDGAGADPDTLFCSSGVRADISNAFLMGGTVASGSAAAAWPSAANRRINQDQGNREIDSIIEVLRDDFGRVMIVRDRWMPQSGSTSASGTSESAAYVLCDRAMLKVCFFQKPIHVPLPPGGDSERGFIVTEFATKLLHASALGFGFNVTT